MSSGVKIGRKAVVFVLSAIMAFTFGMGDVSMAWAAQSGANDQGAPAKAGSQKMMLHEDGEEDPAEGEWYADAEKSDIAVSEGDSATMTVVIDGEYIPAGESFTYFWYEEGYYDEGEYGDYEKVLDEVYEDTTWYCDVSKDDGDPVTVEFYITVNSGGGDEVYWDVPSGPVKITVKAGEEAELDAYYSIDGSGFEEYDFEYYWYKQGSVLPEEPGSSVNHLENVTDQEIWYCDVVYISGEEEETKTIQFIVSPISWYVVADDTVTYTQKDIAAGKTSVTLTAEVRGLKDGETAVYRWQKQVYDENGDSYDEDIPGADQATYEAPLEPGRYCVLAAVVDSATWDPETDYPDTWYGRYIDVVYDTGFGVSNDTYEEVLVNEGEDAVLTVDASNDLDEIDFNWEKEELNEDGELVWNKIEETSKSLTVTNVTKYEHYCCTASDAGGNSRTIYFTVSVKNGFTAEAECDVDGICVKPGEPVTLHVLTTAKQTEPLDYKWTYQYYDEAEGDDVIQEEESVTGSTWDIENISEFNPNDLVFTCTVTDKYGYSKTVNFQIDIDNELEASAEEDNVTAPVGGPATLKVKASAAKGGLTYEWHRAEYNIEDDYWEEFGDAIEGATSDTYTVENVSAYEAYRCFVYDEYGNSRVVTFDVHPDTGFSIEGDETQYIDVNPNETATLEIKATANEGEELTFVWEQDSDSIDEDTATITTNPITKSTDYTCRVSDQYGYYQYVWFEVRVDTGLEVMYRSNAVYADYDGDAVLSVSAKAKDGIDIHYKWYDNQSNMLAAGDESTFTVKNVKKYAGYQCKVYDDYGNSEWQGFEVYVDNGFSVRANGYDFLVAPGDDQTLQVEALTANADSEITYKWYKKLSSGETVAINPQDKETPNIYTVANFQKPYAEYYCDVEDEFGNFESLHFDLYLDTGLDVAYEEYAEAAPGDQVKLKVTPSSDVAGNSYRYKWYRNDGRTLITSYADGYSGATTDELTIEALDKTDNYMCVVTDEYGRDCCAYISVTALNNLTIEDYEQYVDIDAGGTVQLTVPVKADDMKGIEYYWEASLDDGGFPSEDALDGGENTNTIEAKWAGNYYCKVTDKYGNIEHASFYVTVNGGLELTYKDYYTVNAGDSVAIKIDAKTQTPENLKYTWYLPVEDEYGDMDYDEVVNTTGELTYTPHSYGNLRVSVTDGYNTESASIYFAIYSGLEVSAEQTDVVIEAGETATLKVNAHSDVTNDLEYSWCDAESYTDIPEATGNTYTIKPTTPATYICRVSDGYNTEEVRISVRIDTGLSVTAMDTGKAETDIAAEPGKPLTLKATATGGNGRMITYQWYYLFGSWDEGEAIEGATSPTFTVSDPRACTYYCLVSDGQDLQKATINVTVDTNLQAKAYYTINSGDRKELVEGQNITVNPGDTVKMTVDASNDSAGGRIAYYWSKSGEAGDAPPEGTNSYTLKITKDVDVWVDICDKYNEKEFEYSFKVKEPCKHINLTKTNAKAAGCETDGNTEYWTCNECGKIFSDANAQNEITLEDTVIKAAHTLTHVDAVAPTCEKAGNIEYWTCSVCGKYFSNEAGTTEIQQADTVVAATGHNPSHVDAVAAGCETDGNIEHWICGTCGKYFEDAECTKQIDQSSTVIKATGHDWGDWVVTTPATEETEGEETRTCKNCGKTETRTIPVISHTHTPEAMAAKEATCTEPGNIAYWKCTECGRYFDDAACTHEINLENTVVPAKGHSMNKVDAVEATCTEPGNIEHWKCSECGKLFANEAGTKSLTEEEVAVAAKGHDPSHVDAVAPTEEADGNIEHWKCSRCGKAFADEACTQELSQDDIIIAKLQSLKGATVAKIADKVYTGKQIKPAPTVTKDGVKLVKDTDYTVAYKNNTKVGKATVTIKGTGSYTGTLTKTFKINPKKAAFATVTVGKKKMTVKAKTAVSKTGGTTYQIWYKVKGTSSWKKTTSTKQSKVIKSLKKGKKYQVKIRAIKKVGTTTYYGAWSVIKTTAKIK